MCVAELCGKTAEGGWHCEGSGCLAGGEVCMHDAAAPRMLGDDLRRLGRAAERAADVTAAHLELVEARRHG